MVAAVIEYVLLLFIALGVIFLKISRRQKKTVERVKRECGIPDGKVVYNDLNRPAKSLFSKRYNLAGKPDYIVLDDELGAFIPVEVKSRNADRPYWNHVVQLAAYCLLVEETYGRSVPYGLIVYGDGSQHKIPYDKDLRDRLLSIVDEMRWCLKAGSVEKNHNHPGRCQTCSFGSVCDHAAGK